jgi:hypothetical protein
MVVVKVRQRLSVSKRAAQKFYMERFNLKNLNYLEIKEQYQIKISNRFAALKRLRRRMMMMMMMMMIWTSIGLVKLLQRI